MEIEFKYLNTGDKFLYYGLQYIKCEPFETENTTVNNLGVCIESDGVEAGEAILFDMNDIVVAGGMG